MNKSTDLSNRKNIDINKLPITSKEVRYKLSNNLVLKVTKYKDFYLGTPNKLQRKLGRFPIISLKEALELSNLNNKTLINIYHNYIAINKFHKATIKCKNNYFSYLSKFHNKNIDEITRKDIITILQKPYKQGKYEVVKRVYMLMNILYTFAIINEYIDINNPFSIKITSIFKFKETLGYSWIDDLDDLKLLINHILSYVGDSVRQKMIINLFLGLRANNISKLNKSHLNNLSIVFKSKDMKTNEYFSLGITKELANYISKIDYSISNESINKALRNFHPNHLKGNFRFTNHSFRKVLATFTRNYGKFPVDYIDATLAHNVGTKVTRIYMKSNDIEITREVITWWQEFLFKLEPKLKEELKL